jgi:hypothetical protein
MNFDQEEWRPIQGFDGYEVSNRGRVRSWKPERNYAPEPTSPRILRCRADKNGYNTVVLLRNLKRHYRRVATLVAEVWIGSRPSGCFVLHTDGSKTNDTPENLRWGTPAENSADAIKHGTLRRGTAVQTCKLTADKVRFIKSSNLSHSELARQFGVTPSAIWHIRDGRTWKHVEAGSF